MHSRAPSQKTFSGRLYKCRAVKCANDSEVRSKIIANQKCPLCGAEGVSSEDLILRHDIRKSVNDWIAKKKEEDDNEDNGKEESKGDEVEASAPADPWGGYNPMAMGQITNSMMEWVMVPLVDNRGIQSDDGSWNEYGCDAEDDDLFHAPA